jgi:hypothetical protein
MVSMQKGKLLSGSVWRAAGFWHFLRGLNHVLFVFAQGKPDQRLENAL